MRVLFSSNTQTGLKRTVILIEYTFDKVDAFQFIVFTPAHARWVLPEATPVLSCCCCVRVTPSERESASFVGLLFVCERNVYPSLLLLLLLLIDFFPSIFPFSATQLPPSSPRPLSPHTQPLNPSPPRILCSHVQPEFQGQLAP